MKRACLTAVCLTLVCGSISLAATPEQAAIVKDLEKAVADEVAARKAARDGTPNQGIPDSHCLTYNMNMISSVMMSNDTAGDEFIRALRNCSGSEKAHALCDKLIAAVIKVRDEQDAAFLSAVDKTIAQLGEIALKAKHDQELDPLIQELGHLHASRKNKPTPVAERGVARIDAAKKFATQWQDYLLELRMGNGRAAAAKLSPLAGAEVYPVIPRSEILARAKSAATQPASGGDKEMGAILAGVQRLEQLPAAVQQLQNLKQANASFVDADALNAVSWIASSYEQFLAGLPVTIASDKLALVSQKAPARLVSELLLLTIPRSLAAENHKPRPDDSVQSYLDRVVAEARAAADWNLLLRAVRIRQIIAPQPGESINVAALEALITARNQETAGEYALAVASYQTALLDQTGNVPAAEVGESLRKLKARHANEYEQGLRYFRGEARPASPKQVKAR